MAERRLQLNWSAVEGAGDYWVRRDVDGAEGPLPMQHAAVVSVSPYVTGTLDLTEAIHHSYEVAPCLVLPCGPFAHRPVDGNLAESIVSRPVYGVGSRVLVGASLSLDSAGSTLAVGITGPVLSQGTVRIFEGIDSGVMVERQTLSHADGRNFDGFGRSVSLSPDGGWLAVGVPGDDSLGADPDAARGSGAVVVYQRNASNQWARQAFIKAPNAGAGDAFGSAIAIGSNGLRLVVGAPYEDSDAQGVHPVATATPSVFGDADPAVGRDFGAVYVFERDTTTNEWRAQHFLKPPGAHAEAFHGASLAANETLTRMVVGAPGSSVGAANAGLAQILAFDAEDGVWTLQHQAVSTQASDEPGLLRFGSSVSMSPLGNRVVVGDPDADRQTVTDAGVVDVFEQVAGVWQREATLFETPPKAYNRFGTRVLASAGKVWVGVPQDSSAMVGLQRPAEAAADGQPGGASLSGAVHQFVNTQGAWSLRARLKAPQPISGLQLGVSMAVPVSERFVLVGTRAPRTFTGSTTATMYLY